MKLNCKRIDFTYTPGEEIFNFPEESGLPFIFDVEEELTADPAAMDALKAEGINKVSLIAFKSNTIGNKFWRKVGWTFRDDLNYYDFTLNEENITRFIE